MPEIAASGTKARIQRVPMSDGDRACLTLRVAAAILGPFALSPLPGPPFPMRFQLTPGNSLAIRINTHRGEWNGTICEDPANWSCLATAEFRSDYCATGDPSCFHLHVFDPADPYAVIERNGGEWLFSEAPDAFDDQILFFWGFRATSDRGIPERDRRAILFGAYRVQSVERVDEGYKRTWWVRPYRDGWVRFPGLLVPRPRYESLGGSYINQFEAHDVERLLEADSRGASWSDPADAGRFRAFCRSYPEWIKTARDKAQKLVERFAASTSAGSTAAGRSHVASMTSKPFEKLGSLLDASRVSVRTAPSPEPAAVPPPAATPTGSDPFIDARTAEWITATYGEDVCVDLQVAFATRDLVILRGDPGVGKSHLAVRLLDDPARERTLVLPVSATWRGREDLLGYVNPIHGRFDRTPFTQFLEAAAKAWSAGDRRPRMVVFEEFNLSQPEHWLTDVLAISQYDDERDRRIQLAGPAAKEARDVLLSPAVRFVATVNSDHTTRVLSPRVLDRAAIVPLELTAKEALRRVGLELGDASVTTIADLDFLLRGRGAGFSIRSARALQRSIAAKVLPSEAAAVDLILVQQVLSKVRLSAHDSNDVALLRDLEGWCSVRGNELGRCTTMLEGWRERLDAGLDVVQV